MDGRSVVVVVAGLVDGLGDGDGLGDTDGDGLGDRDGFGKGDGLELGLDGDGLEEGDVLGDGNGLGDGTSVLAGEVEDLAVGDGDSVGGGEDGGVVACAGAAVLPLPLLPPLYSTVAERSPPPVRSLVGSLSSGEAVVGEFAALPDPSCGPAAIPDPLIAGLPPPVPPMRNQ